MSFNNIKLTKMVSKDMKGSRTFYITANNYCNSLNYIKYLSSVAEEDFILTDEEIRIVMFEGECQSGMYGIIFSIKNPHTIEGYEEQDDYYLDRYYPCRK